MACMAKYPYSGHMALPPMWLAIYAGTCGFSTSVAGDTPLSPLWLARWLQAWCKRRRLRAGLGQAMLVGFATSVGETRSIYRQWYWRYMLVVPLNSKFVWMLVWQIDLMGLVLQTNSQNKSLCKLFSPGVCFLRRPSHAWHAYRQHAWRNTPVVDTWLCR